MMIKLRIQYSQEKASEMKKSLLKYAKHFIIISLSIFVLGGQPVEFAKEKTFFHGYLIQKPIIRVGLGVNLSDIKVSSSSGMKIYEINARYRFIADNADEVLIRGRKEKLTEKFVIQVAQSKNREEAEIFAQDLRTKIENKVYVTANKEQKIAGTYLVKVGDFLTRGDALSFIMKLNQIGIKDIWILREDVTEEDSRPLWILVNDELKSLHDETVLYFVPNNPQSYLSYNERNYRGIFILEASHKGIVLVNILNLEDYLKAVVPSELSPYTFREIEAHKAQAVAARTYAMKNLGMNDDLGFDLCDTPKSQYYKGMNAEHPLSNKAVELTQGEVALYKGKLIDALYTSTCGGMTENVEEIFWGPPLPYLKSTECVYEKQREWLLKSENNIMPIYLNGGNISQKIASLISLKVAPLETDPVFFRENASYEEALNWTNSALALFGKKNDSIVLDPPPPLNLITLARIFIHGFEWQGRVENLLLASERDFILKNFKEGNNEKGNHLGHLAYLVQTGIFPSLKETENLDKPLMRGELVIYLWKVLQSYEGLSHYGIFKGLDEDRIKLEEEGEEKELTLSSNAFLLRNYDGDYSFASQIYLLGGENVRWIEREGKLNLLEVIYPPHSNILDRSSKYHSWQIRRSREEMEKMINQYYPIGELKDLVPQRRGASKRVVELLIDGTETQATVKGLRVRRVLGLKETLFVIDREYDEEGNITHFTFCGRGWGHGVGLCQVGAFGMALAGADYKEILKKYYQGIKISEIY